ncbi:unnamed protein product [Gadus morhua 'NCC']
MNTNAGLYIGSCGRCREAVHAGSACQALGKLFHSACFTCTECGRGLTGEPFYLVSGRIYCDKDFLRSVVQPTPEVCGGCGLSIPDTVLQARGRSYHPSCFRCPTCRRALEGLPFTVGPDGQPYCLRDYHRRWAARCAACLEPICPLQGSKETTRIVISDRSYHVECYDRQVNHV